jgi:putative ABC transport system permease protein
LIALEVWSIADFLITSHVSERDPFSFFVVSLMLAAISLLACWIAARRALDVDPVVAIRSE